MRPLHLAFALSLLAVAAQAASDPVPKAVKDAQTALARHSDSFSIDDSPQAQAAMAAYWTALTDTVLGSLNGRPGAPAQTLVKALPSDPKDTKFTATALGPDLVELDMSYGEMGDVLLLTRQGGRFGVAWDAAKLGGRDVQHFPLLAAWRIDQARQSCRTKAPQGQWDRCGPIHGRILRLPPDRAGHMRFALDATYAQMAGETVSGQISLWSWDGTTATPLAAKSYGYMIEQDAFVRLEGDVLRVREKTEFKTFGACGACEGRQAEWSLRVGPDRIDDLGTRSLMPELDAMDTVLDAMGRGAPIPDIASDQVVRTLRPIVAAARDDARKDPDHVFSLGYLNAYEVTQRGDSEQLCFSTDVVEQPLLIRLKTRNGRIFLDQAAISASETCPR